jgi:hypothetical protein
LQGLWQIQNNSFEHGWHGFSRILFNAFGTWYDAFWLNEIVLTINGLGEHQEAIGYYEQALAIDRAVYGDNHPDVAIDLNNLGSA